VSITATMIKGTAKPITLTMNSALALQVSDRMPPKMVMAAMTMTTAKTASV